MLAARLTVVQSPAVPAAAPFAQYPKESAVAALPAFGTYVNVPFAFNVTTPLVAGVTSVTP